MSRDRNVPRLHSSHAHWDFLLPDCPFTTGQVSPLPLELAGQALWQEGLKVMLHRISGSTFGLHNGRSTGRTLFVVGRVLGNALLRLMRVACHGLRRVATIVSPSTSTQYS